MKKATLLLALLTFSVMFSQTDIALNTEMNWTKNWTNFDPKTASYNSPDASIPNIIDTDLTLNRDTVYLMSGIVYVTNNATLTIEPGTLIRCQAEGATSLVVTKGSKLIAEGSKALPIVFTSSKPVKARRAGDWGGISILGSGKVNLPAQVGFIEGDYENRFSLYGGTSHEEETTKLAYVRIEFAGKKLNGKQRIAGLSLYALGLKSQVNNIMVSYAADDAFKYFGGASKSENLISYKSKNDDFNFELGYNGNLNNIMAVRHPFISHPSGSHAIEIDGYNPKKGMTSYDDLSVVKISNATLINLSDENNYQHTAAAISTKNHAKIEFTTSKISGFSNVVRFDKSYKEFQEVFKYFKMESSLCNVHNTNIVVKYTAPNKEHLNSLLKANRFTASFTSVNDLFVKPLDVKSPKFILKETNNSYALAQ